MRFDGLQVDQKAVSKLLGNVNALLTSGEQEHLRELARRVASANGRMFEIAVEAAARHGGQDAQAVMNAREAAVHYFTSLSMPMILEQMNEVVKKTS
ncbi:MAG: hypothetical protein QOH49_2501 [Acidobacteriota bacterium]|jgi:hypothetical protein|nr:hypothetical protein [Acidobacteriota bacterium]